MSSWSFLSCSNNSDPVAVAWLWGVPLVTIPIFKLPTATWCELRIWIGTGWFRLFEAAEFGWFLLSWWLYSDFAWCLSILPIFGPCIRSISSETQTAVLWKLARRKRVSGCRWMPTTNTTGESTSGALPEPPKDTQSWRFENLAFYERVWNLPVSINFNIFQVISTYFNYVLDRFSTPSVDLLEFRSITDSLLPLNQLLELEGDVVYLLRSSRCPSWPSLSSMFSQGFSLMAMLNIYWLWWRHLEHQ